MRIELIPYFQVPQVVSVYFWGWGSWRHPLAEGRAAQKKELGDALAALKLRADVIYEATLAGAQNDMIGPTLVELGFKHVHTSLNPNTNRTIYTYVRSPLPLD